MIAPGLYVGDVMHRRLRPIHRAFRYRALWLVLDLDRLEASLRGLRLLSLARFNLFSFYESDHGSGASGLGARIRDAVQRAGFDASGPIRLVAMPRVAGFVFNPLSVYFCYDGAERLSAIVWEVSNTFAERHSYILPVEGAPSVIRQSCKKLMHVSPFIDMDIAYRFRVTLRDEALSIGIVDEDAQGALLVAAMNATRRPLTDGQLLRAFAKIPFSTLKTIVAIHWEALHLFARGVRVVTHPGGERKSIETHSASS